MNNNLLSRVAAFLKQRMRMKRWQRVVTCLAAVAVFGVTYALILPAITMTGPHPEITAEKLTAWSGDGLTLHVTAEAAEEEDEKIFVLSMDETGADLAEKYEFSEEGIALIKAKDEADSEMELELHRAVREDTKADQVIVDYWFTVDAGTKVQFDLDLADEVDDARFSEVVETVKKSAEKETAEDTAATASNAAVVTEKEEAAGKASENGATASDAVKASGSNADIAEANAIAKKEEKIVVEKDDDGFEQILDGTIINDLEVEEDEDGIRFEITSALKVSAGNGADLEAARKDADKNADKRANAQLKFQWKSEVEPEPDMVWSENGANIAVFYDDDAEIPGEAALSVREIEEGSEEYAQLLAQTKNTVKENDGENQTVKFARFFDISILDADGNEIEPAAPVKVVITYDEPVEVAEDGDVSVLHFKDDMPEVIKPNTGDGADISGLSFTTDSFSIYAVYGTGVIETRYLAKNGAVYDVNVSFSSESGIPADASLRVREIAEDEKEYQEAKETVIQARKAEDPGFNEANLGMAALDISIVGADGQEIEPAPGTPVNVSIKMKSLPQNVSVEALQKTLEVQHLAENGKKVSVEKVAASEDISVKNDLAVAEFTVDSFSIYVFTYDVGGTTDDTRKFTVHYGYMNGDTFVEFPDNKVHVITGQYTPTPDGGDEVINATNMKNDDRMYLVYDIDNYVYQNAYYSKTATTTPTTGTTHVYPVLWHGENYLNGFEYQSTVKEDKYVNIANDSHFYIVYKGYMPVEGGSAEHQEEELELNEEPPHEKTLVDNGDGTYTLSLSVTGIEKQNAAKTKADVIIILDRSGSMYSNKPTYVVDGQSVQKARYEWAKDAINALVAELFENNTDGYEDTVRVALITFSNEATIDTGFTTSASVISSKMNSHTSGNSTNWEFPLRLANSLEVREDAETYVLFISDGTPNLCVTRGQVLDSQIKVTGRYGVNAGDSGYAADHTHLKLNFYDRYGVYGTGADSHANAIAYTYGQAVPAGQAIVNAGKHFYVVGGYSSDGSNQVKYMRWLANESYGQNKESGTAYQEYFKSGADQNALLDSFSAIIGSINGRIGFTGINIDDGITDNTEMNAKDPIPGLNASKNFTYTRKGGIYGDQETEWTDAPPAVYEDESVVWDLGNTQLLDGVTYKVSFIVWPNQAAYDIVQAINNSDDPAAEYASQPASVKQYLHFDEQTQKCSLATNKEDPSLEYRKYHYDATTGTTTVDATPTIASPYNAVPDVPLTGSKMKVVKVWDDSLDDDERPDHVDVKIWENQANPTVVAEYTLTPPTWESPEFNISPGLVINNEAATGGVDVSLNTGHDYWVEELTHDYHFEFETEIVHPELYNSNSDIRYKGDTDTNGMVSGVNRLKGGININKQIVATASDATVSDATKTFTIKGTLKDKDGNTLTTANCPGLGYRIFEGDDLKERGDITADLTIEILESQTFRIVNVPAGARWTFTEDETDIGDLYSWESIEANYHKVDESGREVQVDIPVDGKTASGSIIPNTATNVIVTNRRIEYNVDVLKTDETGEATNKLKGATFRLYADEQCRTIAKDINGDDCQPVTTGEDGIAHIGTFGVGTYYLKETMAPNGFILLKDPIKIEVDKTNGVTYEQKDYAASGSTGISYDEETNTYTLTVINNPGKELPHTGGPGTALYTLSGMMLLIASALLYGFRRRHEERRAA